MHTQVPPIPNSHSFIPLSWNKKINSVRIWLLKHTERSILLKGRISDSLILSQSGSGYTEATEGIVHSLAQSHGMEGKWQSRREGRAVALPTRLTLQLIIQTHLKCQSYNIDMLCVFFHLQLVSQRKKGHGHDSRVSKKNKKNNNWGALNYSFMTSTSILSRLPWQ